MTTKTLTELVLQHRTIRGYKPDPVPMDVIREVLDIARNAQSNGNTQPWHIAVVSGASRERLEKSVFAAIAEGMQPNPEWPTGGRGLTGVHKQRQRACGAQYYQTMGVAHDDQTARDELSLRNWKFFGAPHAAFLSMPKTMHRANAVDIGIFLQTVMLLFEERGVSSCPQGALAIFPDKVREVVDIPEGNAILVGMSFGYEEEGALINSAKMPREPLDAIASFAN